MSFIAQGGVFIWLARLIWEPLLTVHIKPPQANNKETEASTFKEIQRCSIPTEIQWVMLPNRNQWTIIPHARRRGMVTKKKRHLKKRVKRQPKQQHIRFFVIVSG